MFDIIIIMNRRDKNNLLLVITTVLTTCLLLVSCGVKPDNTGTLSEQSVSCVQNDFEMILYTDKSVYETTDIVQVWATLEYTGDKDEITIWSGEPFMIFSFTDGKDFNNLGTPVNNLLKSTTIEKGELYRFNYEKSVTIFEDFPDADFWREFAKEKDLRLPVGTYTISLKGDFGFSENVQEYPSDLLSELEIKVVE